MKTVKQILVLSSLLLLMDVGYAQKPIVEKQLYHVLLFQWAKNHDKKIKTEVIDLFRGLPGKIEGLESFVIHDVIRSSGGYDQVVVFQFASERALSAYDTHPDHEKIKELAPPLISEFAKYDYWR